MNSKSLDQKHLIERYLAGDLSDEEAEEFEVYCLEHPEMADEIEIVMALKETLADEMDDAPTNDSSPPQTNRIDSKKWAMAATVLLGLSVMFNAMQYQQDNLAQTDGSDPSAYTNVLGEVSLSTTRGSGIGNPTDVAGTGSKATDIFIRREAGVLIVRLDLGPDPKGLYQVSVKRAANTLWTRNNVEPSLKNDLPVLLVNLKEGRYDIEVISNGDRNRQITSINVIFED